MAKRRRVKPYARPTSFDSNVMYDIRQYQKNKYGASDDTDFPVAGGDEIFHVVEGEILMRHKNSPYYSNGNMHCFSHANGLSKNDYNELEYAGVAVTGFAPEREVYEQGFVANFGGLNTIYNNGPHTIRPGNLLVAMIPEKTTGSKYQEGVPRAKCQFVPMPLDKAIKHIEENTEDSEGKKDKADKIINAKKTIRMNRIMGTALSYAPSGRTVDVILHKATAYAMSELPVVAAGSPPSSPKFKKGGAKFAKSSAKKGGRK
tara:strand:- start:1105 stop:1884 length:780 start_codon:yes stop_codon:yes gene_type:complete